MMPPDDKWMPLVPKPFPAAYAPFPRSTWIHPHVPTDSFDRVCKSIWRRAEEAQEELGGGQSSAGRAQDGDCWALGSTLSHRVEEQQKETDDLGLSTQCKEDKQQYHTDFILPCPYLLGHRHPHVAKSARALSPVMEAEMKRNDVEAKGKRISRDVESKQRSVVSSPKKIWVAKSCSRGGKQSSALKPQPLLPNPIYSVTGDLTTYLQEKEDPPPHSKIPWDTCESEDEQKIRGRSEGSSSDDDSVVTLPGVRIHATDSSDDDSESDNNSCEEEKSGIPHPDEMKSDSKWDSPSSSTEKDLNLLSTIKAGILPQPTEPPASGKVLGQWEIPLSFHPHDIPTATLASGTTAHVQAPVQGKAEAPQANLKTDETPVASTQQKAYDLLADFPALQPPREPLALGALCGGNPNTKDAEGGRELTHSPNRRQEAGASHQRRLEYVPHEVSSICAGDHKPVLDCQTFGSTSQFKSPTISHEQLKANSQLPPRVAGTDGAGLNARSWASAAKAGMKRADAPQEKARPCTFQQIVNINRAKAKNSASQNFASKVTPSQQSVHQFVTPVCHSPRPRIQHHFFVRPGNPQTNQPFGARAPGGIYSPGFKCPRFPFQQARGNPSQHNYV